ncbi:hypothetical protein GCM10011519_16940 [Marmoricola endophyticus]|uniref:Uncharacterized protein n=1 Tax=Marmoricola endophyticus TaxID=2040280 RepID=A0A917BGG5_9ACTN|nr:hypothetical protein GCM10011519_16940 [Marmoricola endophyticus]
MTAGVVATGCVTLWQLLSGTQLTKDSLVWHERAVAFSLDPSGRTRGVAGALDGKEGYPWLIGWVYHFVGAVPLVPILFNIIFLVLTATVVARTTENLGGLLEWPEAQVDRAVRLSAWIASCCPSLLIWIPGLLRESLTWLLTSSALYGTLLLIRTGRLRYGVMILGALAALFSVRDTVATGLGVALVLAAVASVPRTRSGRMKWRILLIVPALGLLPLVWSWLSSRFDLSAESISQQGVSLSDGANSGFSGSSSGGYSDLVLVRLPRVLAGPFPTEYRPSGVMVLAGVEGAIWLVAVLLALRLLMRQGKRDDFGRAAFVIVVAVGATLAMIALSTGNYGILSRMRSIAFVLLLPLSSLGAVIGSLRPSRSSDGASGQRSRYPQRVR